MKILYSQVLFLVLLFSSCSKSGSRSVQDAFSWVPLDATQVMFDNWSQINKDFGFTAKTYWQGEWIPQPFDEAGNEIVTERKKDNFLPYANFGVEYAKDTVFSTQLGFSIPAIEWQLTTGQAGVKKMNANYNAAKLIAFCKRNKYREITIEGKKVYGNPKDLKTEGNVSFNYIFYDEDEKVLVHAYDMESLQKVLNAHYNNQAIVQNNTTSKMLAEVGEVENLYFTIYREMNPALMVTGQFSGDEVVQRFVKDFGQVFLGLDEKDEAQLTCPLYWCIGEQKGGKVVNVLSYETNEKAKADEPLRAKILRNGVSLRTKQPLSDSFSNIKSFYSGCNVVLQWSIPPNNLILTHISSMDTPWNMCGL